MEETVEVTTEKTVVLAGEPAIERMADGVWLLTGGTIDEND